MEICKHLPLNCVDWVAILGKLKYLSLKFDLLFDHNMKKLILSFLCIIASERGANF